MVKKGDLLLCRAVDTNGHNYFLRDEDRICRYVIILPHSQSTRVAKGELIGVRVVDVRMTPVSDTARDQPSVIPEVFVEQLPTPKRKLVEGDVYRCRVLDETPSDYYVTAAKTSARLTLCKGSVSAPLKVGDLFSVKVNIIAYDDGVPRGSVVPLHSLSTKLV